jgi:LAO/AO transport system kinase
MTLVNQLLSGDRRALARLITQIENDLPEARTSLAELYPQAGRAHTIGVTGAPGTGKSSLVNELARAYRRANQTVAIVAVDPTSPFTGDAGVYIRSMATRGSLGGLARATGDVVTALDAAGFDVVLVETVGAGQSEFEIAQLAHTTLVVEAPGLGDDVQAIKAGILEIADILVVNKADQPGSEAAVRALRGMLSLAHSSTPWEVPIVETVALDAKGLPELMTTIGAHHTYLKDSGQWGARLRQRIRRQVEVTLRDTLYANFINKDGQRDRIDAAVDAILNRFTDPYSVVKDLLK